MSVGNYPASDDAHKGQNAGNGREVKFGRMLESLIEHGGYSRNRKRILTRLGISGPALTQYIRQQNWPSFTRLLAHRGLFRRDAVVARIGRLLADRINEVAAELATNPNAAREGLMQDDELLRLESYCHQCDLVSLNRDRVRENCSFRLSSAPILTGLLLYRLDIVRLENEEPALHAGENRI